MGESVLVEPRAAEGGDDSKLLVRDQMGIARTAVAFFWRCCPPGPWPMCISNRTSLSLIDSTALPPPSSTATVIDDV